MPAQFNGEIIIKIIKEKYVGGKLIQMQIKWS